MKEKTVEGFFGPRKMTKEQFVERWRSHAKEIYRLADKPTDYDACEEIVLITILMAEKAWDKLPD